MKYILSLSFLILMGHGVCAQYVEPPWWPLIESSYTGVAHLKECESRAGVPYATGDSCATVKTCFFGEKSCETPYPDTKCTCYGGSWYCDPIPCPYSPYPTSCGAYTNVLIDFETGADGNPLVPGAYVQDEWSAHGITVSAFSTSGFTPDDMPRLFDTSFPGTTANGDPDLGSPNELCLPSGPGVGAGGVPASIGANCDPQGLVLIVQESDKPTPDDNAGGGMIVFDFAYPTDVNSLGLMDIEPSPGDPTTVMVTKSDGSVVQIDAQGFGDNSVENIAINMDNVKQVKINIATSGAVTYLDLCIHPPPVCTDFLLDFETRGDGTNLLAGEYVQAEWEAEYGIIVSASSTNGGFTPDNRPRLFDSAIPGSAANGDPDLGSPNQSCTPSGLGVGAGGLLGAAGENCDPQGLILIVQEQDKPTPDDNAQGGMIVFDFAYPTEVHSVGLMDIDDATATTISVTRTNGVVESGFPVVGLGDNSVQNVAVNILDAKQVKITFGKSGAITNLDLCIVVPEPPTTPPTCAPYGCPTPIEEDIPKGGSVTAHFCIPTAAIPQNLEMCLLSDATGSFSDDQVTLIAAAPGISGAILAASPDAKLGYAAFKDTGDDFVYRLLESLTTNEAAWLAAIATLNPFGGGDSPEAQYDGIACAVDIDDCPVGPLYSDADCGFSSGTSAKKVIVVTTDAPFSTNADIQNNAATTLAALQDDNVVLIGLKAPGATNELDALAAGTGGSIEPLASNGANVAAAILAGLGSLATTVEVDASDCTGFGASFTDTSVEVQSGDEACFYATFTDPGSYPGTTHWCTIVFLENGMAVASYSIHLTVV